MAAWLAVATYAIIYIYHWPVTMRKEQEEQGRCR